MGIILISATTTVGLFIAASILGNLVVALFQGRDSSEKIR